MHGKLVSKQQLVLNQLGTLVWYSCSERSMCVWVGWQPDKATPHVSTIQFGVKKKKKKSLLKVKVGWNPLINRVQSIHMVGLNAIVFLPEQTHTPTSSTSWFVQHLHYMRMASNCSMLSFYKMWSKNKNRKIHDRNLEEKTDGTKLRE